MIEVIYLDYSATTPPEEEVLESFLQTSRKYIGNPNSLHKLGLDAKKLIDAATDSIAKILNVQSKEIIYTSGASEANNMALKGIAYAYKNRGRHLIVSPLEHASIMETVRFLEQDGFEVSIAPLTEEGLIDIDQLEQMIREDTILVSIASVNSETGVRQEIDQIGKRLKKYPKLFFHSDMTQSIGKERVLLDHVDLASLSAQKFYGLKGSGLLYKKENIQLTPLIHGGKSTTKFRSGTPATALIVSLAKALRLCYEDFDFKLEKVKKNQRLLLQELNKIEGLSFNSNSYCLPHIVNISVASIKPETLLHALEEEEIYISTKTACSSGEDFSEAVYALTKDKEKAKTSLRISISHRTSEEEILEFCKVLKEKIQHLREVLN